MGIGTVMGVLGVYWELNMAFKRYLWWYSEAVWWYIVHTMYHHIGLVFVAVWRWYCGGVRKTFSW